MFRQIYNSLKTPLKTVYNCNFASDIEKVNDSQWQNEDYFYYKYIL